MPQRAAAVLGTAGGTVRIEGAATSPVNGASIDVPVAALPGDVTLVIAKAHGPVALDADLRTPPAPLRVSIGGRWTETATVDVSCDSGDSFSDTETGAGSIVQTGCAVNDTVMGVTRTGRVDGQRVTISGPAAIATPRAVLTVNTYSAEGTVSADGRRIETAGIGQVAGTIDGITDRCEIRSRSVLTR